MPREERRILRCGGDGPLEKSFVHYGFSKFQICYFSDFADFVERLENPHKLATILAVKASGAATEAKPPEKICEKPESTIDSGSRIVDKAPLEEGRSTEIKLGVNFLACVWPSNSANPTWIFVDVVKKKLVILKSERKEADLEETALSDILLGSPKVLGSPKDVLGSPKDAKYKIERVVSIIIDSSSSGNLTKKIKGHRAEKLTADEYRLATYIVIRKLVNVIINDNKFIIDGIRESLSLGLLEEDCDKLATYIAGLAPKEDERFAKRLISVIKSPRLFASLKREAPASSRLAAPLVSPCPSSNSSASLPNSLSSKSGSQLVGSSLSTPRQIANEEESPKKDNVSPTKGGGACPPSPLGVASICMPGDFSQPVDPGEISIWQKLKLRIKLTYEKWKALPLRYKIMAVMVFAIGGGAIVYGSVFCPPIAVLVPFVGVLNASAIAVIGGAIVASIAFVAHAFHVAFTNVNYSKIEGEENYGLDRFLESGRSSQSAEVPLTAGTSSVDTTPVSPSRIGEARRFVELNRCAVTYHTNHCS